MALGPLGPLGPIGPLGPLGFNRTRVLHKELWLATHPGQTLARGREEVHHVNDFLQRLDNRWHMLHKLSTDDHHAEHTGRAAFTWPVWEPDE